MLDAFKNLGNLTELARKAKAMQENLHKMQEEMARKQVTAEAGAGMVRATVNGKLELVKLQIDRTKIDPNDTEMLEDVIVAAVQAAQNRALELARAEMQKVAGDWGLPTDLGPLSM
jgi:hypothetical protein